MPTWLNYKLKMSTYQSEQKLSYWQGKKGLPFRMLLRISFSTRLEVISNNSFIEMNWRHHRRSSSRYCTELIEGSSSHSLMRHTVEARKRPLNCCKKRAMLKHPLL
nr:uncharacterized protein LOC114924943 [Arachis hypogaea]